ncbi:MAG: thiol peroxidase [Candidatus Krumholzibacteriota bacterium]|nr:thiol peroxidase [Candidatus Krumholzibacteriota bacterium]
MERQITTMGGNPITLIGPEIKVGDTAPDFTVLDNSLDPKTLADFGKKIKLISVAPSLDTGVCDTQNRKFNELAANLSDNVVVLTITVDLPFAQKRWCGAAGIDRVITLSDHRDVSFGKNYGVLIKEVRLLNRAVFILDENNVVRYIEIVKEVSHEPDYDKAMEALGKL